MHEVPRFTKKFREFSAVEHEMNRPPRTHRNRDHAARLRRLRLERMPPEIAMEPRRPHCRDVPFPTACELLTKTAVECHTVRMSDGQEAPTLDLSHATWGLNPGQLQRNSRQRFMLAHRTALHPRAIAGR